MNRTQEEQTEGLIEAINDKLNAHKPELARSTRSGRITWHQRSGKIEVSLELKL